MTGAANKGQVGDEHTSHTWGRVSRYPLEKCMGRVRVEGSGLRGRMEVRACGRVVQTVTCSVFLLLVLEKAWLLLTRAVQLQYVFLLIFSMEEWSVSINITTVLNNLIFAPIKVGIPGLILDEDEISYQDDITYDFYDHF